MKSNYKRLGDFITPVKVRNSELKATELLGININKYFMPSVANIVGTDLSKYKVVQQNQFACNRMHVGRDYRIPVALSQSAEPFMVSPAYDVFEIENPTQLIPEYLMMWFSRAEFDRNAWFYTDADVRGGLAWQAFEDMQLPIPHIDKQREIVKEYNTIQNRIALNQQLIQKLEETAQAIYREWFVEGIDNNSEKIKLNELVQTQYGYTETASAEIIGPKFLRITDIAQNQINWSNVPYCKISDSDFEKYRLRSGDIVVARTGATAGYGKRLHKNFPDCVFASFLVRLIPKEIKWNLYLGLTVDTQIYRDFILSNAEGSAQPQANATLLTSFEIDKPDESKILEFNRIVEPIFDLIENYQLENQKLTELKELLLSKLATVE
ncbi:restriction endonuclease subunit S [Cecembia lonarensis]|uniref:EcoKI restriction-modification system protein HsdS n=1 Tax=Cecembia lonarensis (strain CCUG 58316 / KCTC 22772 / LW9) TaxID=1225176 RepID=K1M192_CECL9|nr:restriction endonuclease subunit S [Cecembia lonarensis]EKB50099.1 EcoKI restriction-modification system protein HsdS [Cecembia lonarensis LW9]